MTTNGAPLLKAPDTPFDHVASATPLLDSRMDAGQPAVKCALHYKLVERLPLEKLDSLHFSSTNGREHPRQVDYSNL